MSFKTRTTISQTFEINQNPFLTGLAHSYLGGFEKWSDTQITYTLNRNDPNPDGIFGSALAIWSNELTVAIEQAHADLEAVSNLNFIEVADVNYGSDNADIDYWYYRANDNTLGYSYGVGGDGVFINETYVYKPGVGVGDGLTYGGYNYETVIHELLHNLGLGHPHPEGGDAGLPGVSSPFDDTGNYALNQTLYTVMSYNSLDQVDYFGNETTGQPFFSNGTVDRSFSVMGAFDIAMIQTLYGENWTTATGDDVYQIANSNQSGTHYKAIWDAGGTDEFIYNGFNPVTIDLRAATLNASDGVLAGGMLSSAAGVYGGYTIARGTVIENATGGNSNDTLTGNSANNVLTGGEGRDTLDGGSGDDLIFGGTQAEAIAAGFNPDQPDQRPDDMGYYDDPLAHDSVVLARLAGPQQAPQSPSDGAWWNYVELDGFDAEHWPIMI